VQRPRFRTSISNVLITFLRQCDHVMNSSSTARRFFIISICQCEPTVNYTEYEFLVFQKFMRKVGIGAGSRGRAPPNFVKLHLCPAKHSAVRRNPLSRSLQRELRRCCAVSQHLRWNDEARPRPWRPISDSRPPVVASVCVFWGREF
jgi:hypothetical protein